MEKIDKLKSNKIKVKFIFNNKTQFGYLEYDKYFDGEYKIISEDDMSIYSINIIKIIRKYER